MLTEKSTVKTEVVYSDDRKNRYRLTKEWDSKKPRATIIMTNPSTAEILAMDYTTLYIMNNAIKDFGSIDIVNLYSQPTVKLNTKDDIYTTADNLDYILKSAEKSDKILIAWGTIGEGNKKVRLSQLKLLEKLRPYKDKMYIITNGNGKSKGCHPLSPAIRSNWCLESFNYPEALEGKQDINADQAN